MPRPIILKSLDSSSHSPFHSPTRDYIPSRWKHHDGPTRWGIMGAGQISQDWAVGLLTLSPEEHVLGAISARKLENAIKFQQEYNIPKAYGSYEDLAKDPEIGKVVKNLECFQIKGLIMSNIRCCLHWNNSP